MPTNSINRPNEEWLTLYEATAYVAWGEVLDLEALPWHGYPSARTYDAEIQSAFSRCREELQEQERCVDFVIPSQLGGFHWGNPGGNPGSALRPVRWQLHSAFS